MIGWNFPANDYGEEEGINDAGIETFTGNIYESLAREIIQNSLDAKMPGEERPVQVNFELNNFSSELFSGREEFIDILNSCKEFQPENEEIQDFFGNALDIINSSNIPVLKISDFNTTGLLGSQDPSHGKDWINLIKGAGSSDKGSGKGGSFGIGKNAVFACSDLRAVFYSTLDHHGYKAFQGVSRLMRHNNKQGHETRRTGFYGVKEKNSPVFDMDFINNCYVRDDVGTDLFIFSFKIIGDWKKEITKSIIENFFLAIHEEKLIVRIQDSLITASSLPEFLKDDIFKESDCLARYYFKSLISPDKHPFVEDDLIEMGKAELFILPEKNYPKRVAIIRDTGMKIFNKDKFQTPIQFAGIFIARGKKLNDFMRKLEPPSHNAWEPHRHKDPELARQNIKKIYQWINEKVRSLAVIDESEELDVEGISDYLPDDFEESELMAFDSEEGTPTGPPVGIDIKIISPVSSAQETGFAGLTGNEGEEEGAVLDDGGQSNEGTGGTQPTNTSETVGEGADEGLDLADENGEIPTKKNRPVKLKKVRTFCIDPEEGKYKIIFMPSVTCNGTLKISTIGDDGAVEPAPLEAARHFSDGAELTVDSSGRTGPLKFVEGEIDSIEIILSDALRCAMEVSANAN